MIGAELDHLAVAAESQHDLWPRYVGDLGGEWIGGGETVGFASYQVVYANGMKLEALEPANVEANDFLRRFLDRNGPGPHHVTYKVPDLEAAMAAATAAGFDLVGVDLSDPGWMEAFIHPKQGFGIVVQLAQSAGDWEPGGPPDTLPTPSQPPASLDRIVHLVEDLDACLGLFRDVLGGDPTPVGDAVELAWPGAGRIRFVPARTEADRAWLDGRIGRLHHVDFTADRPAIRDAVEGDGVWVVDAASNLGVPLHVHPR